MRWREQKTLTATHLVIFSSFFAFFLTVLFKEKCEFKRSHSARVLWKPSVLLVTHITDCPFYFCMEKKNKHILPAIFHKLYQQPFFTDNKKQYFLYENIL